MNKKDAIRELSENLQKYLLIGFIFHPKFLEELKKLIENLSGNEKEIFALFIKQLNFVKVLQKEVYKADGNEIIKYQNDDYYSLHLSGKNFNIRFLMTFDNSNNPVFLVAFYERSGKRSSNYSQWYDVLESRLNEIV